MGVIHLPYDSQCASLSLAPYGIMTISDVLSASLTANYKQELSFTLSFLSGENLSD